MLKDLCFEIIKACPNNCLFCSSNASINCKDIIDYELFKKTLEYIVDNYGLEEISISGGEPFLHPNILEIIELCKSKKIRTIIFTSGIKFNKTIMNEEKILLEEEMKSKLKEIEEKELWNEAMKKRVINFYQNCINVPQITCIDQDTLNKLKNIGLDKIVFDWQALEEDSYNKLMGTKTLLTCLINSVIKTKKAGLDIDVHYIPNKLNYKQLPDLLEILEVAGVKNLSILNFVPQGRGEINQDILMLNQTERQEFISIYNSCKNKYNVKIRIGIPLDKEDTHKCTAGLDKLVVKYDGNVLPCPAFKEIPVEQLTKYGVKNINIRKNLEDLQVHNGTRKKPLCKTIYNNTKMKL